MEIDIKPTKGFFFGEGQEWEQVTIIHRLLMWKVENLK